MSGVAVVGGGMAGLAAAQRLARGHGVPVTLFDQGQRSGGRASSRDFAELSFDHGAQFFSCMQPRFKHRVEEWLAAGVAAEWEGAPASCMIDAATGSVLRHSSTGPELELCAAGPTAPPLVGVPSMQAIASHVTRQIQEHGGKVLTGHRVTGARLHDGGGGAQRWALHGELLTNSSNCSVDLGSFAALVLADSSCLLPGNGDGGLVLEGVPEVASARRRAQQLEHLPSFALMVAHPHSLRTSFDAGYVKNNSWFSWVANNSSKPGRPKSGPECWTALATTAAARQLLEQHGGRRAPQTPQFRAAVAAQLLASWRELMAPFVRDPAALAAEPTFVSAQRWGRAFVGSPLGIDCMARAAARMAVCGDFCGGSTMESSWCSGEAAADVVVGMLDKGGCSLDD